MMANRNFWGSLTMNRYTLMIFGGVPACPSTEVSNLLTMLELKGMVKQVGCMHYVRIREASPIYGN